MTLDDLSRRVLDYVQRPGYQPVKPRVIARKLGLDADQTDALRATIKRLVKRGAIAFGAKHLVYSLSRPPQLKSKGVRTDTDVSEIATLAAAAASAVPAQTDADLRETTAVDIDSGDSFETDPRDNEAGAADADSDSDSDSDADADSDADSDVDSDADSDADSHASRLARDFAAERAARREERRAARIASRQQPRAVVTGVFRRASGGFGFVRPQGSAPRDREGDIYIPLEATGDAASGDVVTVRVDRRPIHRGGRMRAAGEIVEVLERQTRRFVGVYEESLDGAFVRIDGGLFADAVAVGDPRARQVATGDKVVVEMVRFPTHFAPGEAVLVEVLGAQGEPGVDTLSIIHEFALPHEFPEDVLADARWQVDAFRPDELSGRQDLTGQTVVTIDPPDARDFDDAISLARVDKGHWLLGVHIADVAHFVPRDSALDREARDRGTSVYLPDRVLPMLPEPISNHLASLQPGQTRFSRTAWIEFTAEGVPVHAEVRRSAIRSCRRFTYEEVDEYLAAPEEWRAKLEPSVHALLERMHTLAMLLRSRRLEHGAIELSLPEVKLELSRAGRVVGARLERNTASHQIIEEFMLAANQAVATLLHDRGVPCLRRIHESPDPRKLQALTRFCRELGFDCDSLESRFEIKRILAVVEGQPAARAVNFAVLKSFPKARYGPDEEGHFALHFQHYAHFTSPIRRYPDLAVHRLFDQLEAGQRPRESFDALMALGEHCSEREQRAERAERELIKVKLLTHLAERIGERMAAVITGVEPFGLFAQGVELPAEGLVSISSLLDDMYDYDADSHSLTGRRAGNRFQLGDPIQVEIARVDVDRRTLEFRVVDRFRRGGESRSRETRYGDARSGDRRGRGGGNRAGGRRRGRRT
ncbi:MAG: ribonuclease R family protein [Planctomycetota bacterium]